MVSPRLDGDGRELSSLLISNNEGSQVVEVRIGCLRKMFELRRGPLNEGSWRPQRLENSYFVIVRKLVNPAWERPSGCPLLLSRLMKKSLLLGTGEEVADDVVALEGSGSLWRRVAESDQSFRLQVALIAHSSKSGCFGNLRNIQGEPRNDGHDSGQKKQRRAAQC